MMQKKIVFQVIFIVFANWTQIILCSEKEKLGLILVGETGSGKTSILNALANACAEREDFSQALDFICEVPKESALSQTMECKAYHLDGDNFALTVLDSKGFASSDCDQDDNIANSIAKELENNTINALAFVANVNISRFTEQTSKIVKKINMLFPEGTDLFQRIIIIFTHCDTSLIDQGRLNEILTAAHLHENKRLYFSSEGINRKQSFDSEDFFYINKLSVEAICGHQYDSGNYKNSEKIAKKKLCAIYSKQLMRNASEFCKLVDALRSFSSLESKIFRDKRLSYEKIDKIIDCVCDLEVESHLLKKRCDNADNEIAEVYMRINSLEEPVYLNDGANIKTQINVVNRNFNLCYPDSRLEEASHWCERQHLDGYKDDIDDKLNMMRSREVFDYLSTPVKQAANCGFLAGKEAAESGQSLGKAFLAAGSAAGFAAASSPILIGAAVAGVVAMGLSAINEDLKCELVCKRCKLAKSSHREEECQVEVRPPEIDAEIERQRLIKIVDLRELVENMVKVQNSTLDRLNQIEISKIEEMGEIYVSIYFLERIKSLEQAYFRRSLERSLSRHQDLENKNEILQAVLAEIEVVISSATAYFFLPSQ